MNLTAKQSEVRVIEKPRQKKKGPSSPGGAALRAAPMPAELDLRGMDTLEAIPVLERYIDSAVMGKLQTVTNHPRQGHGSAESGGAAGAQTQQGPVKSLPPGPLR